VRALRALVAGVLPPVLAVQATARIIEQMATSAQPTDERWDRIYDALVDRGLSYAHAAIAAYYVIECLDVQEAEFEKEREPFG